MLQGNNFYVHYRVVVLIWTEYRAFNVVLNKKSEAHRDIYVYLVDPTV